MRKHGRISCALAVGALFAVQHVALSEEAKQPAAPTSELKCVVGYGDSITKGYALPPGTGWVELLSKTLKTKDGQVIPVFNAGGNGNTSREGLRRISNDVLSHMPGTVFVEFGGNDGVHDEKRNVGIEEFERNLITIDEKITSKGGAVVFVTFPPIVDEWHAASKDPYVKERGGVDKYVEQYREKTREIAKRLGRPLFDLDKLLRDAIKEKGQEKIINKDGVHLTPESSKIVADAIQKFLSGCSER